MSKNLQQNFVESIKGEILKNYQDNFQIPISKVDNNSYANAADNLDPLNETFDNELNIESVVDNEDETKEVKDSKNGKSKESSNSFSFNGNGNGNSNGNGNGNGRNSSKDQHSVPDIEKVTKNCFLWNDFHCREFFNLLENKIWVTWCIYGFVDQIGNIFHFNT